MIIHIHVTILSIVLLTASKSKLKNHSSFITIFNRCFVELLQTSAFSAFIIPHFYYDLLTSYNVKKCRLRHPVRHVPSVRMVTFPACQISIPMRQSDNFLWIFFFICFYVFLLSFHVIFRLFFSFLMLFFSLFHAFLFARRPCPTFQTMPIPSNC